MLSWLKNCDFFNKILVPNLAKILPIKIMPVVYEILYEKILQDFEDISMGDLKL